MIVDKGGDIKFAAEKAAFGGFCNYGQTCVRPDYLLVDYTVVNEFMQHLKECIDKFYQGGKDIRALGKVINDFHNERLCALLADHQGTVMYGNPNAHQDKNLLPTVILNPSPDSPLMQDEIFGPILPVITTKSYEEAQQFILARDKPLAAYYFGKNSSYNKNLTEFKLRISAGSMCVNDCLA